MPEHGIMDTIFLLKQYQDKYIQPKKWIFPLCLFIWRKLSTEFLGISFDRQLVVEEWLIRFLVTVDKNTQSQVRIYDSFSDDFLVQVGWYCSLMLLVMLVEALSREINQDVQKNCFMVSDWFVSHLSVEGYQKFSKGQYSQKDRKQISRGRILISTKKAAGKVSSCSLEKRFRQQFHFYAASFINVRCMQLQMQN